MKLVSTPFTCTRVGGRHSPVREWVGRGGIIISNGYICFKLFIVNLVSTSFTCTRVGGSWVGVGGGKHILCMMHHIFLQVNKHNYFLYMQLFECGGI